MNSAKAKERIRNFSRRFNPNEPKTSAAAVAKIQEERSTIDPMTASSSTPTTLTNGSRSTVLTGSSNTSSSNSSRYHLRPPTLHRKHSAIMATTKDFVLPDLPWLVGTWHVTHSTLPLWKDKRNVRITYGRLPGNKLDDVVTYQSIDSGDLHTVHGVDTPKRDGRYLWRGKGMLMVASSKWEVLGWGGGGPGGEEEWIVTYFNKTMFTPAGIDIYARTADGLSERTVEKLRQGLAALETHSGEKKGGAREEEGDFTKLVRQLFVVKRDNARPDKLINNR